MIKRPSICIILLVLALLGGAVSCQEENDTLIGRTHMVLNFYRLKNSAYTLMGDTMSISAYDTDSILGTGTDSTVYTYSLPLRYSADSTVFVLTKGKSVTVKDTLVVKYTSHVHFFSMDKGSAMLYNILNAYSTNHFITSVSIVNKEVTENEQVNVKIFMP